MSTRTKYYYPRSRCRGRSRGRFFEVELKKDDHILICTDGLTNMVEDEEICSIILRDASIEERAGLLVKTANDNGGKDNITVMIIEPFS